MPNLENLKKQAKLIVRWHRDGYYAVGGLIRTGLPRYGRLTDKEILALPFTLAEAQELLARQNGFESWDALKTGLATLPDDKEAPAETPTLLDSVPVIFVSDVTKASAYYRDRLGFRVDFLHGNPPFYGAVGRDGAALHLRFVHGPVFDEAQRKEEGLLAAYIVVENVKALFLEYKTAGVDFAQTLKREPWGAETFMVRDPDGNVLCFAAPVG